MTSVKTTSEQGKTKYPVSAINILKAHGKSLKDSQLLDGYALNLGRAAQVCRGVECVYMGVGEGAKRRLLVWEKGPTGGQGRPVASRTSCTTSAFPLLVFLPALCSQTTLPLHGSTLALTPRTPRTLQGMPKRVEGARIACLDMNLQKARMHMGVQVLVSDPAELEKIRERESDITRERIQKIIDAGM